MKNLAITLLLLPAFINHSQAQLQSASVERTSLITSISFIDYQKTFPRPNEALKRKEDTLKKQFEAKKLSWPAKYIYLRSFKYDSRLEVWVKDEISEKFKLFNTYKVCALAGTLGPKRMEGDYQVPEGFYYINEFNPRSSYHLSLGINYPNASDRILSDLYRPGGEIFIHGSCVTVGCIPLTDGPMEDVYILAAHAKNQGQDFIPVHIFPVKFNVPRSVAYLENFMKDDARLKQFTSKLEDAFFYFEKYHQLPVVLIDDKGEYFISGALPHKKDAAEEKVKKPPVQHRYRNITEFAEAVHQWPEYPGGAKAFAQYLKELGNEMTSFLPDGTTKTYVKVEFIIDLDGMPTNFKIARSINEDFDDELISRMEKMGRWKPALLHDKPVAKKMVQTITIEPY